ncbi:MAG: hypothetical protein L3K10_07970 [Thermoplasmata archaeon]|nr:hypothetical protein [Thermoplasmata archaeon]
MAWGGIKNVPPGFDVFGAKRGPTNIVDEAIGGHVEGLPRARESLFADLKRHGLHQDYARYFDSSLVCASVLGEVEDGKYRPELLRDIVEPALKVAIEQMESIQKDVAQAHAAKRKMMYDPLPSLDQLHLKAHPLAVAYPEAAGAKLLEPRYHELSESIRAMLGP